MRCPKNCMHHWKATKGDEIIYILKYLVGHNYIYKETGALSFF